MHWAHSQPQLRLRGSLGDWWLKSSDTSEVDLFGRRYRSIPYATASPQPSEWTEIGKIPLGSSVAGLQSKGSQ